MICYHNLDEIEHDVLAICLVRIRLKNRARCLGY